MDPGTARAVVDHAQTLVNGGEQLLPALTP